MAVNWEKIVRVYNKITEEHKKEQAAWDAKDAQFKASLEEITNFMLSELNASGTTAIKTSAGTFYRKEKIIPAGADWDKFYKWIAENDAFDALERRIKATFISDYMEKHDDTLPPGVSVFRQYKVGVRKS